MSDDKLTKLREKLSAAVAASDGIAGKLAAMEAEAARLVAGRPQFVADILRAGDGADRSQLAAYNERLERLQIDVEGMRALLDESFVRVESARAALTTVEDEAAAAVENGYRAARDEALQEFMSYVEHAGAALIEAALQHEQLNESRGARGERFETWAVVTLPLEAALKYYLDVGAGRYPLDLQRAAGMFRDAVKRILKIA